jgi:transposase
MMLVAKSRNMVERLDHDLLTQDVQWDDDTGGMFIRHFIRRNKDGSTRVYLYLCRNYMCGGKERQELVANLGRMDILQGSGGLDRLIGSLARYSERCWVEVEGEGCLELGQVYGAALVFRRLWEHLGLDKEMAELQGKTEVQFSIEEAAFAMVLHRILDPGSKRRTHTWMRKAVYRPEFEGIELHHLYRALDYLVRGKERLEQALFARGRDLFSLGVDLVLFDTTLVHFEGAGPEGLAAIGRPGNYPDCVKVLVGLVMTGDGYPVAHHVFPGNTADINAFRLALAELRQRFPIRRVVIVADRGMVSEGVMEELEGDKTGEKGESKDGVKIDYILGMRMRRSREVNEEVLSRAGRYREVADNLRVKEVRVGDHRYVVCHNSEAEERDRKRREEIIKQTRENLKKKGVKAFVVPRGVRRFVELVGGELVLKEAAIREEARYDGKWVLRTNTELPADEVALAYKSLWQIERAFRELKSGLEISPVFLRAADHVRGHILVCFLALVMEATLRRLLAETGSQSSYQVVLDDLAGVTASRFEARGKAWLWRTELPGVANDAFRAVGLRPPSRVQPLS